ncbi:hypothetical protein [Methanosalsum zhilinae]|nr:hypothetical protein [Methanosalsum zhilinae]
MNSDPIMLEDSRYVIYGIDFSGSQHTCSKIWITKGIINGPYLELADCYPLEDIAGKHPQDCYNALRDLITGANASIFGMDFPLSVPLLFMDKFSDWTAFIKQFPERYSTPENFRKSFYSLSGGKELKRITESKVKAPFSSYNLRLFRQTYYGICNVIHPLLNLNEARFLPMQKADVRFPWVIEICPACTLKKEKMYHSYKGKSVDKAGRRSQILDRLINMGLNVEPDYESRIIDNTPGDALDSVIASMSVFYTLKRKKITQCDRSDCDIYRTEGYIFS